MPPIQKGRGALYALLCLDFLKRCIFYTDHIPESGIISSTSCPYTVNSYIDL